MKEEPTAIVDTPRLLLREIAVADAPFINRLLNTDGFLRYIGDRGVRSDEQASDLIRDRYQKSYSDHGYGLYLVEVRNGSVPIGMCGFVRRDSLPGPDIGFAFLPEYERKGYGFESASAAMEYGRRVLGFKTVYAITSPGNDPSDRLLTKLGFEFLELTRIADEELKLFSYSFLHSAD